MEIEVTKEVFNKIGAKLQSGQSLKIAKFKEDCLEDNKIVAKERIVMFSKHSVQDTYEIFAEIKLRADE